MKIIQREEVVDELVQQPVQDLLSQKEEQKEGHGFEQEQMERHEQQLNEEGPISQEEGQDQEQQEDSQQQDSQQKVRFVPV